MLQPLEIKSKLENETGFKISTRVNGLKSSMRGYITFTIKNAAGKFNEWSFEYQQQLLKEFEKLEPRPTFASRYQLHIYFGAEAYNYIKAKAPSNPNRQSKIYEVQGMKVPKAIRLSQEKYFIGYTTNYGRIKGHSSKVKSAGWGCAPNVVHGWYQLNPENIKRYAIGLPYVYLQSGEKHRL